MLNKIGAQIGEPISELGECQINSWRRSNGVSIDVARGMELHIVDDVRIRCIHGLGHLPGVEHRDITCCDCHRVDDRCLIQAELQVSYCS